MSKNYDSAKIQDAIEWLGNGGTKKGACQILGVSSNPTMERIIKEYGEDVERDKRIRAEKRRQAVSKEELVSFVVDYLNGLPIKDIADRHHRSTNTVKQHLETNGAMLKHSKVDPTKPPLLPEACLADTFDPGQYVWSAKYNCIAQITGEYKGAYSIQVLSEGRQFKAYQAPWELGCLKHLEALGVNLSEFNDYMGGAEAIAMYNQTLIDARKRETNERNSRR